MHYIGLMSGTSVDAIDAALVELPAGGGLRLSASHSHPIPEPLRAEIQALMLPGANEIDRAGALDVTLGRLLAAAANALLHASGIDRAAVRAIGSHGQTVRHRPHGTAPFTLQLGDPAVIAEETGLTVVADFRARDLAAGGQGAPLVPAFHQWLFQAPGRGRGIVNIGGIANVTWLPADPAQPVIGFDTGPGNTLLDRWVERHLGRPHDAGGEWAAGGTVQPALLERLLADRYFALVPPKSTGREHFHLGWLEAALAGVEAAPRDVQATLAELTARSIAGAIERFLPDCEEVYLCGGGTHNRDLRARLVARLGARPLADTTRLGLDPDWVEATAFAWLAQRTLEGFPGNLPSVTGARHPAILGGIYRA